VARPFTTLRLKKLLKQATPDQLRRARCAVLDHYDAIHAAGLLVESPERVALEALQIAMEGEPEPPASRMREYERRDYGVIYTDVA